MSESAKSAGQCVCDPNYGNQADPVCDKYPESQQGDWCYKCGHSEACHAPPQPAAAPIEDSRGVAHEIWAAAQLAPGEGIEDAVARIASILAAAPSPVASPDERAEVDAVYMMLLAEQAGLGENTRGGFVSKGFSDEAVLKFATSVWQAARSRRSE